MDIEFVDISTSLRLQLGYGIGHLLNDVCASLWFTYLLVFFHLVLDFSASQAGNLMLIGQIVDAVATPFIGYHSDHTDNYISRKYGKRKLWHFFGTVCILASFPFIFSNCIGCSMTHKWAQMFYFSSFIMIFQIGWASVQISHLSLIPELSSDDNVRTHLTAIRYGFTVSANLFVYLVTWVVLHITGDSTNQQVGPEDAWKFRHIVYIVMAIGVIATIIFHLSVREKQYSSTGDELIQETSTHASFLKRPVLYQIAGIYMSTRLVVNISQVLIPLYIHRTLGLAAQSLAIVPLSMHIGSLFAATIQRIISKAINRKIHYFAGTICVLTAFIWIFYGHGDNYNRYYIYLVAILIGFGGAVMLVTSLALTADLVGSKTKASAFVYGLMSFTDKLSCGIAIAVVQKYADGAEANYYRDALTWVCGMAAALGLLLTLFLPQLRNESQFTEDTTSINVTESTASIQADI